MGYVGRKIARQKADSGWNKKLDNIYSTTQENRHDL